MQTNSPADGPYDFVFRLYGSPSGGTLLASATNNNVAVRSGLFEVQVGFGGTTLFDGDKRWLEIATSGSGLGATLESLSPRQAVLPTPCAIYAGNAGVAASALGVAANAVGSGAIQSNAITSAKIADGTIQLADLGTALATGTFWRLLGNGGTTPGTHFLGTSDNQAFEIKVNNLRQSALWTMATVLMAARCPMRRPAPWPARGQFDRAQHRGGHHRRRRGEQLGGPHACALGVL